MTNAMVFRFRSTILKSCIYITQILPSMTGKKIKCVQPFEPFETNLSKNHSKSKMAKHPILFKKIFVKLKFMLLVLKEFSTDLNLFVTIMYIRFPLIFAKPHYVLPSYVNHQFVVTSYQVETIALSNPVLCRVFVIIAPSSV